MTRVLPVLLTSSAHAITDLPLLLRLRDRDDRAYEFVAQAFDLSAAVSAAVFLREREECEFAIHWTQPSLQYLTVRMAHTTGMHLEHNLAFLDLGRWHVFDLEWLVYASHYGGLHRLWQRWGHAVDR